MLGALVMTGLCLAGIAFNVRFMAALIREPRTPRVVYRLRVKLDPRDVVVQPFAETGYQATSVSKLA